jgi:serine/threonine protein kinase
LSDVRIPNWNAGLDAKNGSASSSSVSLQSRAKQRPEEASVDPLRTPTQHGGQAETDSQIDPLDEVAAVGRDLEDVDMDSGSPVTREATRMPSKLSEFELVETLGCGTFGRVCLVRVRPPWRSTSYHPIFPRGQPHVDPLEPSPAETARADMERPHYAMKILAKSEIVRLKQVEHINNELSILKAVRHPFLIQL